MCEREIVRLVSRRSWMRLVNYVQWKNLILMLAFILRESRDIFCKSLLGPKGPNNEEIGAR